MTKGFSSKRRSCQDASVFYSLARKYLGIITAMCFDFGQLRGQGHDSSVVPFTFPLSIFAVRDPNWIWA